MRAYLLGTLGELEASELEASYFLDPARLRWLESIEDALIGDYLHDRLARADRQRFEARYLEVPVLQQRLEAVRSRILLNARAKRAGAWPMLRIALVCMALLALGIGTWRYQLVPQAIVATAARKIAAVPVASFSIRLAPGVSKGAHTGAQEFAIPPAIGKVSLTLELPGRTDPVECAVRLLLAGSADSPVPVWTSPRVRSQSSGGNGELTVEPPPSVLLPGDYIAEVLEPAGAILESYVFRVNRN